MSRTIKNEAKYAKKRKVEKAKLSRKFRDFKRGSNRAEFTTEGSFKLEAVRRLLSVSEPVAQTSDSLARNEVAA